MYFGSLDPLTVAVLVEVMKSGFPGDELPLRVHPKRPRRIIAAWRRLARLMRRSAAPAPKARTEASAS